MLKHKKTFKWYKTGGPGFDQKNNSFDPKWHETHFYPGQHGLSRIDPVNLVLVKNDGFDPKRPETHFFTLVDMVWPVLTR
jgi:hypothetical protein